MGTVPMSAHSFLVKVIEIGTIRKLGCGFLFAFHSNYGSVLHHLRDKATYWSKNLIVSYPPLHSTPRYGSRRSIAIPFGMEKNNGGATQR